VKNSTNAGLPRLARRICAKKAKVGEKGESQTCILFVREELGGGTRGKKNVKASIAVGFGDRWGNKRKKKRTQKKTKKGKGDVDR